MADQFDTIGFIAAWVQRQGFSDAFNLYAAMVKQYLTDPELYDRLGMWRCYDDAMAAREG